MTRDGTPPASSSLSGAAWALVTTLGGPLIELLLAHRRARGRENPDRMDERRGRTNVARPDGPLAWVHRSEEHQSELQSLMRIAYAVLCLKTKHKRTHI